MVLDMQTDIAVEVAVARVLGPAKVSRQEDVVQLFIDGQTDMAAR